MSSWYDSQDYLDYMGGNGGGGGDPSWMNPGNYPQTYDGVVQQSIAAAAPTRWTGGARDPYYDGLPVTQAWEDYGFDPSGFNGPVQPPGYGYVPPERGPYVNPPNQYPPLGPNESWRPTVPATQMGRLSNDSGFRSWPTKQGPPQDGGAGDWASGGLGQRGGNPYGGNPYGGGGSNVAGWMQNAMRTMAANQADARARALADRNKAESATGRLQRVMTDPALQQYRSAVGQLKKNPYDAEFLNYARGQLRDSRALALQAAEQQLVAQYAAMGRPVDPQTLAQLRMQATLAHNGDLRDLLVQTAGLGYNATLQQAEAARGLFGSVLQGESAYNDALYRVLANTEYDTGNQDLATLLALARLG